MVAWPNNGYMYSHWYLVFDLHWWSWDVLCHLLNEKGLSAKKWFQGLDLQPNVRYQTETVQGHLVCTSDHKTMHGDGVETEKL